MRRLAADVLSPCAGPSPVASRLHPSHLHVVDAGGKSLVVQWDEAGNVQAINNPLGVLANNPRYEQQVQVQTSGTSRMERDATLCGGLPVTGAR